MQGLEPVIVQALVAEPAVEALDVAVLHRSSWLDQDGPAAMPESAAHEAPAGELRTVVGPHDLRIAAEDRGLIEQACYELSADAVFDREVDALVAAIVSDRRHLSRRPLTKLSLTKSMLHASLTIDAACNGTRSLIGRFALRRLRTAKSAAL